jgi:hypothetical protein
VTEYVSGELGRKIKAIICEWWNVVGERAVPTEHLESSTIYERLVGEGVEVPDHATSEILVELAKGDCSHLNFRECRTGEVRRTPLLGTSVNRGNLLFRA